LEIKCGKKDGYVRQMRCSIGIVFIKRWIGDHGIMKMVWNKNPNSQCNAIDQSLSTFANAPSFWAKLVRSHSFFGLIFRVWRGNSPM